MSRPDQPTPRRSVSDLEHVSGPLERVMKDIGASPRFWVADPHQWGRGKVHIVEGEKTVCGRLLTDINGRAATDARPTCKGCESTLRRREERARQGAEWQQQQAERQAQREAETREWWDRYNAYLESPEWEVRREHVLERAGWVCEGCGEKRAVQVHHVTYRHVCDEFLWELRAVCLDCHGRLHADLARQWIA